MARAMLTMLGDPGVGTPERMTLGAARVRLGLQELVGNADEVVFLVVFPTLDKIVIRASDALVLYQSPRISGLGGGVKND